MGLTENKKIDTLSIDRKRKKGADVIFLSMQSKKGEVLAFLEELRMILETDSFRTETDLVLIRKRKKSEEAFSTPYTLLDLDYTAEDVADRLRELTLQEYSETKIDKDDLNPPQLFVFGKRIHHKLVYIKLKIRKNQRKYILCVSFHYAKEKMDFPYA